MSFGTWDFGLSDADEARAAKLHADSIIVDMLVTLRRRPPMRAG